MTRTIILQDLQDGNHIELRGSEPAAPAGGAALRRAEWRDSPPAGALPAPRARALPARDIRQIPYVKVCERSPESLEADADDVIDLGAPRCVRPRLAPAAPPPRRAYVPNPRLYPGPPARTQRTRRAEPSRPRRRKRGLRRPVPNSRLYRPPAPPPPPAPARPRAAWPAPAPLRALDTASRAALRLGERRPAGSEPARRSPPPLAPPPEPARSRHLVVTLPAAAGGDSPAPTHYRPASAHFRARAAPHGSGASTPPAGRAMEASPERASGGHESPSAPSEYLAEFLSAIMRRQYAEALEYCRLILQYEPQNATARGFRPLLVRKVRAARGPGPGSDGSSSSPGSDSEAEEASSEPHSEGGSEASAERSDSASCSGLSAARWDSSRSDADDNGNPLPAPPDPHAADADADARNDNSCLDNSGDARLGDTHTTTHSKIQNEPGAASVSLQRLRAQFCSIK